MMTLVATGGGGPAVANEKLKSASIASGGSSVSASEIWLAATVTVQVVLNGRSAAGVSVKALAGEAVCANGCGAPAGHSTVKALPVALTLSLKLMTMAESTGTFVAAFAGVVAPTAGAPSPGEPPAVTEKSSTASPWSLPPSSGSCHRNQISRPLATVTASVADLTIRFPGALPSSAAAVAPVIGPVKLSSGTVIQPVAGALAPVMMPGSAT